MADTGEVQQVQSDIQHWIDRLQDETDKAAPVDYGYGPGVSIPQAQTLSEWNVSAVHIAAAQIPTGGSNAHLAGVFGAPIAWPIIPIHVVLLPDGRVMSYGTNQMGQQGFPGSKLVPAVLGTGVFIYGGLVFLRGAGPPAIAK
jgi:hypothetical protein